MRTPYDEIRFMNPGDDRGVWHVEQPPGTTLTADR